MTVDLSLCPCGSTGPYESCCGAFHSGTALPETAEQLMRSRYSAYVKAEIDYLKQTLWPAYQKQFDPVGTLIRAKDSRWIGLEILASGAGQKKDKEGFVLFIARSVVNDRANEQREKSLFRQKVGRWYYLRALPESQSKSD
ncbi:YchJ family protein [Kiloniella laminariae]|uniref:YchJ family protein n=1 Tax=Kiloniella laminariae TaxID=454162 RepID=UPI0003805582|nr:YchJ family metal-binding protein [Kiloniella laminariae]